MKKLPIVLYDGEPRELSPTDHTPADAGNITYDSTNDPVTNESMLQAAMLDQSKSIEQRVASLSGVVSGGTLAKVTDTTFSILTGNGEVYNSYTTPGNTSIVEFSWPTFPNETVNTFGSGVGLTSIFLTSTGLVLQVNAVTLAHFRANVFLGNVYYVNNVITEVTNAPSVVKQTATDLYDLLRLEVQISGTEVVAVTDLLQIYTNVGTLFFPGANWGVDKQNPNLKNLAEQGSSIAGVTMQFMVQDGSIVGSGQTIPTDYNSSGAILSPLANSTATIHRVYSLGIGDTTRTFILLYGQNEYSKATIAKDNLLIDGSNTTFPAEIAGAYFLGYVCTDGAANDFNDLSSAWIASDVGGNAQDAIAPTNDHSVLFNRDALDAHPLAAITNLQEELNTRLRPRGDWINQEYVPLDAVLDQGYYGYALVTTTDRLAPQGIGDPTFLLPDIPVFATLSNTTYVTTGIVLDLTSSTRSYQITGQRVWLPDVSPDVTYRSISEDLLTGEIALGNTFTGAILDAPGYIEIVISPFWVLPGAKLAVGLIAENSSTATLFNHPWIWEGNSNQENDPGIGNATRKNDHSILRISTTDADGTDRSTELGELLLGATIKVATEGEASKFILYEVIGSRVDNTSWYSIQVSLSNTGALGEPSEGERCQLYFDIPVVSSTDYVRIVDEHLTHPSLQGFVTLGDNPATVDANSYGMDLKLQEFTRSFDWFIMSYPSISGSGGDSGDGGDGITDAPSNGTFWGRRDATWVNPKIDDSTDVTTLSPIDGQVLAWDTDHWKNSTIDTSVPDHNDTNQIQGGQTDEYFHLTQLQLDRVNSRNIDGGNPDSVYLPSQHINGGTP